MNKKILPFLFLINILVVKAQVEPLLFYKAKQDPNCEQWVDSVYRSLSLKERVGQLFIHTIAPLETKHTMDQLKEVVREYKIGGLLFSGGSFISQAKLTNQAQEWAKTPLLITFDGEWGLSMRLKDTPRFPRNMVLGCIKDQQLLYKYGAEVARQCKEMGVHVNFAPVADVNINPKNPVINTRSFGEDPTTVAEQVIAYATGLESGGVVAVCKHFPGHGDTDVDSHKSLPLLPFSKTRLDSVELLPFRRAIRSGVSGMMVGHLEVPILEKKSGLPSSLSKEIVTKLLKEELAFKGLVFTDALAMRGASTGTKETLSLQAIRAGNDMVLAPRRIKEEIESVVKAVKAGEVSEASIEERCRKILAYKYAVGLAHSGSIQISGLRERIHSKETDKLIQQLDEAAIVVAKNEENYFPLPQEVKDVALLVLGEKSKVHPLIEALKSEKQVDVFTSAEIDQLYSQGALRKTFSKYERIVCCNTENRPIAITPSLTILFRENPVATVFLSSLKSARREPQFLSLSKCVLVGHTANLTVQRKIGNALLGKTVIDGVLPERLSDSLLAGSGIRFGKITPQAVNLEEYGVDQKKITVLDSLILKGIENGAFPGSQLVILKEGKEIYNKAFGTYSGEGSKRVSQESVYDLASVTKTSATLLAIMKLYDKGLFNLDDKLDQHLPELKGTNKGGLRIRELLLHESGVAAGISVYDLIVDKQSYGGRLFSASRSQQHTVRLGARTWGNPNFNYKKGFVSSIENTAYSIPFNNKLWFHKGVRDTVLTKIIETPLRNKSYRYSCLGFILLQQLVERLSGMPMDLFLTKEFYDPMKLDKVTYLPLSKMKAEMIVPSTTDRFFRKGEVLGTVHDETALLLGGVSGNAGLFANATQLAILYQMLLDGGEWNERQYLSKETCRLFTTTTSRISRRGLGFDKPNSRGTGYSPCGDLTPKEVYGHTGFTGSAVWVDPKNKLVFVFLTNRTYPSVWPNKLSEYKVREELQDAMYRAIK